jgi:hypothetical protein
MTELEQFRQWLNRRAAENERADGSRLLLRRCDDALRLLHEFETEIKNRASS